MGPGPLTLPVVFPADVLIRPLASERAGGGLFEVARPFDVVVFGQRITVAQGFVTDGASIPWWARVQFCAWGRDGLPALLHDWLLTTSDWPKWLIDFAFLAALRSQGVPELQAHLMYFAVRTRPKAARAA